MFLLQGETKDSRGVGRLGVGEGRRERGEVVADRASMNSLLGLYTMHLNTIYHIQYNSVNINTLHRITLK